MFNIGEIVHRPHFPEGIEIKRCELFGEFYIINWTRNKSILELMLEKEKLTDQVNRIKYLCEKIEPRNTVGWKRRPNIPIYRALEEKKWIFLADNDY